MNHIVYGIIILVLIGIIIILAFRPSDSNFKNSTIQTLVRQSARWSTAATQDQNPLISVLHANYGAGYLWALQDIATDQDVYSATGVDFLKLRNAITKVQDQSTMKLAKACPNYAPQQSYLVKVAEEGS